MESLSAPIIDNYISILKHNDKITFTQESWDLIDTLFSLLNQIKPCGEDNLHELWITAPRGKIADYGNYEDFLKDQIVSNKDDFEKMWKMDYPDEIYWYRLNTISFKRNDVDEFKAISLNSNIIVQSPYTNLNEVGSELGFDISKLINFLIESVKTCIRKMKNGSYNDFVSNSLPYNCRYGTIVRNDYWKIYNENKEEYLKNISASEIDKLKKFINCQENFQKSEKDKYKISKSVGRIDKMTAGKFYYYCTLGYKENQYSDCYTLSPKELYYKYADGRDEGLKYIDENSPTEFDNWYNNKTKSGGHPWEVCRGGNSTHVSLFVCHDEYGYYLLVAGKSFGRSIETIKFYLALKRDCVPVFLDNALELLNRILGTDKIGIVPYFVMPFYCESCFPNENILDFMHLQVDSNREILKYIKWMDIRNQYLND